MIQRVADASLIRLTRPLVATNVGREVHGLDYQTCRLGLHFLCH